MPSKGGTLWIIQDQTVTGRSKISAPCLAGDVFEEAWDEIMSTMEFRQTITYKDYADEYEDSLTGQKIKGTANEYTIYAHVELQTITDKLVRFGALQTGDARIFLPARIRYDINNEMISAGEIRPHLYDDIVYRGITYRIKTINFFSIGETEVYCEALCGRVQNDKPERWA